MKFFKSCFVYLLTDISTILLADFVPHAPRKASARNEISVDQDLFNFTNVIYCKTKRSNAIGLQKKNRRKVMLSLLSDSFFVLMNIFFLKSATTYFSDITDCKKSMVINFFNNRFKFGFF